MIDFNKTFETDRVLLRPISLEDLDEMTPLCASSEMWYYFTADLSSKDELEKWIKEAISLPKRLALTIIDKATGKIAGSTSLNNYSENDTRIEIGWTWVAKEFQGTGLNAHVKNILLNYCFAEAGIERVELKTDVLNMPARKAMQKIGLVEEGILRSHTLMTNNRRRDTLYYSLLIKEWKQLTTD